MLGKLKIGLLNYIFRKYLFNVSLPVDVLLWRQKYYSFLGKKTILVYSSGKSGSTTVAESLICSKLSPLVYQVHYLTDYHVKRIIDKYNRLAYLNLNHIKIGQLLSGRFDHVISSKTLSKVKKDNKWIIFALVRDPVATIISRIFQGAKLHRPELFSKNGELSRPDVEALLMDYFSNFDPEGDIVANWFDNEFLKYTDINIYDYKFDTGAGFGIIRDKNFDIAIMTMERLNQNLQPVISKIFEKDIEITISNKNVRNSTKEGKVYSQLLENMVIPKEYLNVIYSTKYSTHFYGKEHIELLIEKWSKSRK